MTNKLKYTDETDKSLGVAGMAISLIANDGETYLASVSLMDDEDTIALAEETYFTGNPRMSAKIAWKDILRKYQIASGLMLGNVLCRCLSAGRGVDVEMLRAIHDMIISEGREQCSLDGDEAENIYDEQYDHFRRIFAHPTVASIARDFASTLRLQRRMTAGEVFENLKRLSSI